jgi:integrase/recombinase XerD
LTEAEQITPLRRRMLEDMSLRNMSPATQRIYVNALERIRSSWTHMKPRLSARVFD